MPLEIDERSSSLVKSRPARKMGGCAKVGAESAVEHRALFYLNFHGVLEPVAIVSAFASGEMSWSIC